MVEKLSIILEDIKFEHTLFALPFALMSAFIASEGFPPLDKLFWILVAMVGARSTAMSFNRIVDADYDRRNVRTKKRALPSGKLKRKHYAVFILISVLVFELACYRLNALAFALSPAALFILLFYYCI